MIYNVIYLLNYSKVGPITCIVCHATRLTSGFKIRSTFISRCHIQSIFRSVIRVTHKDTTYSPSMLYLQGFSKDPSGYDKDPQLFLRILQGYAVSLRIFLGILQDNKNPQGFLRIIQDYAACSRISLQILEVFPYKDPSKNPKGILKDKRKGFSSGLHANILYRSIENFI